MLPQPALLQEPSLRIAGATEVTRRGGKGAAWGLLPDCLGPPGPALNLGVLRTLT